MYDSPIQLHLTEIQKQIVDAKEETILKAVQRMGVEVKREELIRALKYDRGQYEKGYADGRADSRCEWIPVTERLPGEECLAVDWNGVMMIGYVCGNEYSTTGYGAESNCEFLSNITHWMPLPEAPKEG